MKICSICKIEKPIDEFHKHKGRRDGLNSSCKECTREKSNDYYKANKEKCLAKMKIYAEENKDKNREYHKSYRKLNEDRIKSNKKSYFQKNKEIIYKQIKHKKETNPLFKLQHNLRGRTYNAFKRSFWTKNSGTEKLLGATYEVVFNHLESRFTDGMTWENQGEWHIDHIVPLASATTEEELIKLCHYTNLQPLWAEDNLKKGDKILVSRIK